MSYTPSNKDRAQTVVCHLCHARPGVSCVLTYGKGATNSAVQRQGFHRTRWRRMLAVEAAEARTAGAA
jgi:hypothetical protein